MNFQDELIQYVNLLISCKINLVEYAKKHKIPIYVNNHLNKGWKGHVVEHLLNLSPNSKKGSDYPDLEIKTVPVVYLNNVKKIKETVCLSVIDINELTQLPFEKSSLLQKIKKTLFIFIDVTDKDNPQLDSSLLIDFTQYPDFLEKMKYDYDCLVEHILDNIYHDDGLDNHFSGKLGKVIQPRPKTGKNGNYTWAFYLKKDFLQNILNKNNTFKNII